MELWQGDIPEFIQAANGPRLAASMADAYTRINRRKPPESEYASWEQSLAAVARVADDVATDDVGVLVEYHMPLSERRIDVMLFGRRADGLPSSLLVELKRWTEVALEDQFARNVMSGGAEHVHPSEQALDYAEYLRDVHSSYADTEFGIQPCAFCHDMSLAAGQPLWLCAVRSSCAAMTTAWLPC
jgi:hypothetical protein